MPSGEAGMIVCLQNASEPMSISSTTLYILCGTVKPKHTPPMRNHQCKEKMITTDAHVL